MYSPPYNRVEDRSELGEFMRRNSFAMLVTATGGVHIPYHLGLEGHSDADVLLHAICDALLGAASLGDIGTHFPDTDPKYQGSNSRTLLKEVAKKIAAQGYRIVNIDCTIVAQEPRLAGFLEAMRGVIAAVLETGAERVNVKVTSPDGLGAIGRGEGIAAHAVVLLEGAL